MPVNASLLFLFLTGLIFSLGPSLLHLPTNAQCHPFHFHEIKNRNSLCKQPMQPLAKFLPHVLPHPFHYFTENLNGLHYFNLYQNLFHHSSVQELTLHEDSPFFETERRGTMAKPYSSAPPTPFLSPPFSTKFNEYEHHHNRRV